MDKTSITTQQNRKYCQTTCKFIKSQTGVFILFITKQWWDTNCLFFSHNPDLLKFIDNYNNCVDNLFQKNTGKEIFVSTVNQTLAHLQLTLIPNLLSSN